MVVRARIGWEMGGCRREESFSASSNTPQHQSHDEGTDRIYLEAHHLIGEIEADRSTASAEFLDVAHRVDAPVTQACKNGPDPFLLGSADEHQVAALELVDFLRELHHQIAVSHRGEGWERCR